MSLQSERAYIDVVVQPKSSRSGLFFSGDIIKIYLHSPPSDGRANDECIKVVAEFFGIAKSYVSIIRGEKSKKKKLCIEGLSNDSAKEKLGRAEKL